VLTPASIRFEAGLSDTLSTDTEIGSLTASAVPALPALPAQGGKILRFPTAVVETSAPVAAASGGQSAFQRLAAVRRRRGSDRVETPAATLSTRPSVSQLVTWLLNLRKGGVGYLYWNAAKLPIEVALVRAARLDDGAIVDVVGHRMLVVEPLRPHTVTGVEPTEGVLP
jgi:hypothetical protein